MKQVLKEWPITLTFFLSIVVGFCLFLFTWIKEGEFYTGNTISALAAATLWGTIFGLLLFFPLVLSVMELVLLIQCRRPFFSLSRRRGFDGITLVLGFFYTWLYLGLWNGIFFCDVDIQNPVFWASPILLVLGGIGLIGYAVLSYFPGRLIRPGRIALAIGAAAAVIWGVQVILQIETVLDWYLLLYPFNILMIFLRTALERAVK